MSKTYSIRELSEEFAVTPRTLRFYEEKGLLLPTRNGQNRIYSAADRTRIKLILRDKRLGLSLEESNGIIAMYQPQSGNEKQLLRLLDKIREKRQQLLQQQRDLELMLLALQEAEDNCLSALGQTG